jgi:hypothetical protein
MHILDGKIKIKPDEQNLNTKVLQWIDVHEPTWTKKWIILVNIPTL